MTVEKVKHLLASDKISLKRLQKELIDIMVIFAVPLE